MIPRAIVEAPKWPLPDRSGFFVLLDVSSGGVPGVACPDCGTAMAFCVLRQRITPDPFRSTWSYTCLGCAAPARGDAA